MWTLIFIKMILNRSPSGDHFIQFLSFIV